MSGWIPYCSESLFGGFLFLFLILNVCVTPCLCLRREVESCWSRAEGSKDCDGPQFLVVFAMHCSLHFKYLDFFKGIEHLRGEDRDADWLDLLLKVTEDTGDTFDIWQCSVLLLRDPVKFCCRSEEGDFTTLKFLPVSVLQLRFRNSHFLIYYNTSLTNHWYLRSKAFFLPFFLFSFSFFFTLCQH